MNVPPTSTASRCSGVLERVRVVPARVLLGDVALAEVCEYTSPWPLGRRAVAAAAAAARTSNTGPSAERRRSPSRSASACRPVAQRRRRSVGPRGRPRAPTARSSSARPSRSRTCPRGAEGEVGAEPAAVPAGPARVGRELERSISHGFFASHTSVGENRVAASMWCRRAFWPSPWIEAPCPTGCGEPSAQDSPVSSRMPHQRAARGRRRSRRDRLGHRLGHRVEHGLDRLHRRPPVEEARRGRLRVEHRAGPRDDLDRPEVALVRRLAAAGEHRHDRDAAAETVDAIGQLTGPGRASGAFVKSSAAGGAVDLEHDLERDRLVARCRRRPSRRGRRSGRPGAARSSCARRPRRGRTSARRSSQNVSRP